MTDPRTATVDSYKSASRALWETQRRLCTSSLYFLAKEILGYPDLDDTLHKPIADAWQSNDPARMVLIPRGHLKSTLCTIAYAVWLIIRTKGRCRILIVNATLGNAKAFVSAIADHLEGRGSSKRMAELFPEFRPYDSAGRPLADKWTEEAITVRRDITVTEPTVQAVGMGGNVVSAHYTHIIYDDVVNADNTMTSAQIDKVLKWYKESQSLFVPGREPWERKRRVVGTIWHYADLYAHIEQNEPDYHIVKRRAIECPTCGPTARIEFPLEGTPTCLGCDKPTTTVLFPTLMPLDKLRSIRCTQGSSVFANQYLMDAISAEDATFKREWLCFYPTMPRNRMEPGAKACAHVLTDLNIFTTIDPAVSMSATADYTAIVTCGWSADRRIYILDVLRDRLNPHALIDAIFKVNDKWHPLRIGIEDVAFARTLEYFFRQECQRRSIFPPVEPLKVSTQVSKDYRIRALQPYAENGLIWLPSASGMDGLDSGFKILADEMLRFPRTPHDDVVDATCMTLQIGFPPAIVTPDDGPERGTFTRESDAWDDNPDLRSIPLGDRAARHARALNPDSYKPHPVTGY